MPKTHTYYEVKAINEAREKEILFGSYDREDCEDEIEAERDNWKEQGYRKIHIKPRKTIEAPDPEVYSELMGS